MEQYLFLIDRLNSEFNVLNKKRNLLSKIRLFLFLITCISFYFFFLDFNYTYLVSSVLLLLSFLFFVSKSVIIYKKVSFIKDQLLILNEIRDDDLSDDFDFLNDKYFSNVYNKDLDILEGNSLFNRINKTQSLIGNFKLKYFLSNILKEKKAIDLRQLAIKELEGKIEWSVQLLAFSKNIKIDKFKLFEGFDNQFKNVNVKLFTVIYSVINIIFFVYILVEGFPKKVLFFWVLIAVVFSQIVNLILAKKINKTLSYSVLDSSQFDSLVSLVKHIEDERFVEVLNKELVESLIDDKEKASDQLKAVQSTINGLNALTFPIVGFLLNSFFLWKLYFIIQFEHKTDKVVRNNENWLEVIATFEAFISFSIFNNKFNTFSTPIILDDPNEFSITEAFHPLLGYDLAVKNSFETNRSQSISIITGANMAGKSTFLRTVGVNLVLAMNGLNVSAKEFKFYPMDIFTSIRTVDDLSSGDSYFKNEINKLKILINRLEDNIPQFIILDEILKGTNSRDKLIGSQKFLEKLILSKTDLICFIATHDLELTKLEENYPMYISNYCFELKNLNENYFSDYILRKGVTQVMNAIYLMKEYKIID